MSNEAVYHDAPKTEEYGKTTAPATVKVEPESETVEKKDPGMFDFLRKKKEVETPISSSEYEQKVDVESEPKTEVYGKSTAPTTVKVEPESETVEKKDRGMFDFLRKKKVEETPISSSEYEQKVDVESEPKTEVYGQTTAPATVKVEPESETVEKEDRGMLDFLGKKKEEETPISSSEYEQKVDVESEPKTEVYGKSTAPATVKVEPESETVEKEDRGMLDFLGNKKEEENKYEETPISSSEYEQKDDVFESEPKTQEYGQTTAPATVKVEPESETVEKEDRGMFDFLGKKKEEEKKYEETPISSSEYEQKVDVSESEPKSEEQPETLFQKMHISHSDSGSSSEEEGEDGEKKKKKKKALTEQLKEKIEERKERKEEEEAVKKLEDDNCVPIEKYEEEVAVAPPPYNTDVGTHAPTDVVHHDHLTPEPQEKKGLMEKIKEKLPGHHKKPEEQVAPPLPTPVAPVVVEEEPEKKGIFEKIKEKIHGSHSKSEEEKEKEKVKESY